jgi:7-keto-8-aminopelargonate synthetase-like enzyme
VPEGTARLRISLNAKLTDDEVEHFSLVLQAKLAEVGSCAASS